MKGAVINKITNVVENIVVLSESSDWQPPEGFYLKVSEDAAIGAVFTDGVFVRTDITEAATPEVEEPEVPAGPDSTKPKESEHENVR